MEYSRILTCKAMTTDEIWVRILIYNDCGTEKFLNVFFPVKETLSCYEYIETIYVKSLFDLQNTEYQTIKFIYDRWHKI